MMVGIDGSDATKNGSDWFCYHSLSPCVFPVGFCEINNIDLTPPTGEWSAVLNVCVLCVGNTHVCLLHGSRSGVCA